MAPAAAGMHMLNQFIIVFIIVDKVGGGGIHHQQRCGIIMMKEARVGICQALQISGLN